MKISPERLLHIVGSIASIIALIAGGAVGEKTMGGEWGTVVAASLGALSGLLLVTMFYAFLYIVLLQFRRSCPHCGGTGWAVDNNIGGEAIDHKRCEVCGGGGKIW